MVKAGGVFFEHLYKVFKKSLPSERFETRGSKFAGKGFELRDCQRTLFDLLDFENRTSKASVF